MLLIFDHFGFGRRYLADLIAHRVRIITQQQSKKRSGKQAALAGR
jgi:hypothetical protein